MRIIGNLSQENQAQRFCAYLTQQGIVNFFESGQIWVADEDRLVEATEELRRFSANPADPRYTVVAVAKEEKEEPDPEVAPKRQARSPITTFFLALCIFIYVLNFFQESRMSGGEGEKLGSSLMTPVQEMLLYELPITPYWQGLYDIVFLKLKGEDASEAKGPLFVQIREGEFWRLFSPAVLHLNFFHILFNMIWLWMLGRPIEARIGSFRLLLFTLFVGIATNTGQYLMSGPLFLGFSGIVTAWAGFIWMRQKIAPWEGYPVNRSTIFFLALFIFAMLALQIVSFLLLVFTPIAFSINIANTAHICGFIFGLLLGRLPYFAWRVR